MSTARPAWAPLGPMPRSDIARQRAPLGPDTSIWPCLTSSGHEICHIGIMHETLSPFNLSHMDFLDGPAAIHWCRLITWGTPSGRGRGVRSTLLTGTPEIYENSWKIMISENHKESSRSTKNHSKLYLMTPRHHLNDPWSILRTSIFHHFSWFSQNIYFEISAWNSLRYRHPILVGKLSQF